MLAREVGADLGSCGGGRARPGEILRAGSLSLEDDLDDVARTIEEWRDAGFGYLVCGWPSQGRGRVEEFAARFCTPG